jgi:hypothetical protein
MASASELEAATAALPREQRRFLDFVAQNPECLRLESFALAEQHDDLMPYAMQPWPLFLAPDEVAPIARATVAVCRLIQSIPRRIFANEPARIAEFYRMPPELAYLISSFLERTAGRAGTIGRGDFVLAADGLKCCEFNMAGNLGGAEMGDWSRRFLRIPLLSRYLAESGLTAAALDPARETFAYALAEEMDARRGGPAAGDREVNLAIVREHPAPALWQGHFRGAYRAALTAAGLTGDLFSCQDHELSADDGRLWLDGRRIHLVLDAMSGAVGRSILTALLAGSARAYNGPPAFILSDKRNLALLSELADAGPFDDEERQAIRAHVPWTRRVAEEFADYRGERVYLPDLLDAERDRLVLKKGASMHGDDVHAGRFTPPAQWTDRVRAALADGTWVAQEFVESRPFPFLSPAGEVALHDVIWGLFVCGESYGSGFLRMMPRGETGVVNTMRGARTGLIFEVRPA